MGLRSYYQQLLIAALLLAGSTAQAAITGVDRGIGGNSSSEASTPMSPTSTIAAGSTGLLLIAADNANGATSNFPTTASDSAGNTWVLRANNLGGSTANGNLERAIYVCDSLATQLTSSGYVTITYVASVISKAFAFVEATPATAGNFCLFKSTTGTSIQAGGTTASLTNGYVGIGDIIVGMTGAESVDTFLADSDSSNGSWSTMQHTGYGSGAAGMSIISQYKTQTTATSTQTYNPTLTAADCATTVIVLTEVPPLTRTSAGSTTGETTTTVTFNKALAAGSYGVLCWTGANAGAGGSVTNLSGATLTDLKNNVWTRQINTVFDNGAASAGCEIAIYTAPIIYALAIGDTLGVTYTNSTANKSWTVLEFPTATAYAAGVGGGGATTASPTTGATSSITNGDYIIGAVEAEGDNTWVADSDTLNGSWSSPVITTASNVRTGIVQYKKVTASGAQTYNPTLTSADTIAGWIELTAPAGGLTAAQKAAFFQLFP